MMTAGAYATILRQLEYHIRGNLARDSRDVLSDAASQVEGSASTGNLWAYLIPSGNSLMFAESEADPRLRPDLYCKITSDPRNDCLAETSVVLRIWSEAPALSYRVGWDSDLIKAKMEQRYSYRRVLLRMHFDRAIGGLPEPMFHMQVGGIPDEEERESCWFPHIPIPRILHPPLDMVLACEIVLANFFPESYSKMKEQPEWRAIIRKAHSFATKPYYDALQRWLADQPPDDRTLFERFLVT